MKKILVLGPGGAGKTTFARELASILQIELIHLDAYYWKPGWVASTPDEWIDTVDELMQKESWVMDGNYRGTLVQRLYEADTAILLDMPRWQCLWRVLKRWCRYAGQTRPDMAEGCPERLTWQFLYYIWTYPGRSRPRVLELLDLMAKDKDVVVVRSPRQATEFLANLTNEQAYNKGNTE
jgi:adenylate kinase family enzyme